MIHDGAYRKDHRAARELLLSRKHIMSHLQFNQIVHFSTQITLLILCLGLRQLCAFAAEVVYIDLSHEQSKTLRQLEAVARFYGLNVDPISLADGGEKAAFAAIQNPEAVAIVIAADGLPAIHRIPFLKMNRRRIPVLVAGITEETSRTLLYEWSSGAITGCQKISLEGGDNHYAIAKTNDVTRQLGGITLPLQQREVASLELNGDREGGWLIAAIHGNAASPVFFRTEVGGENIFFATETTPVAIPITADPYRQQAVFAALAFPMIFLHYAAGERAWHSPGDYANFTIDDLWLREPYGHVNYSQLLQQAQEHNFHATVAFIPWNFDRNQSSMISLFQAHSDRLSICIHGNNHVHQEFGSVDTHPISKQVNDIKQSLARMEKFSHITHIPYDAVMVFPHSISPETTLSVLKRYNFLATANSLNVPSDAQAPSDTEFALRTGTMQFANFPSLRRYSAESDIPKSQLAIDAFLGNPMLFYAHESFFASGIGAFNRTADMVNRLQPDTQWRGLGYIARHLYLERMRDDGNYDVNAYSADIALSNPNVHDAMFFVEKAENFALPISVFVDGKHYAFERSGEKLLLQLPVRSGGSREITIRYGNDLNLAAIDVSNKSLRIYAIRILSDFRDDVVSRSELGRWFIHSYAYNGAIWNGAIVVLAVAILDIIVYLRYLRRNGGLRSTSDGSSTSSQV
jgi:peptidoglycan/xylan/chitin deacetylase (PgdA/CDA1 family)